MFVHNGISETTFEQMSRQPSWDQLSDHGNREETNHVKHRNYWTEKESYDRCDDNMCNDQLSLHVQLVGEENDMKHRNYLIEKENYGRYDEKLCNDQLSLRHVQLGPQWLESDVATMNDSLVKPPAAISLANTRNNVDTENSNLECQICFRRFYHVRNLRNHLEQHNNVHYRCPMAVADPGFSKWGGAVLSQMGGCTSCFQVKSA